MDKGALVTVTALTAAVATTIMALLTNYPIALAPGMGINAFFTFTICLANKVPWQEALGMVFVNGVIFLLLSLTGIREKIVRAIPYALKIAITCGIGLFIAFIGLKNGGVIVGSPATYVTHGDFTSPAVALCLAGVVLTAILVAAGRRRRSCWASDHHARRFFVPRGPRPVRHGAAHGNFFHAQQHGARVPPAELRLPEKLAGPADRAAADPHAPARRHVRQHRDLDRRHQARGLSRPGRQPPSRGPRARGGLHRHAAERALRHVHRGELHRVGFGVEAGGRTGLTTITTAVLMLLALFLTPLILIVPAAATAPALVVVGIFMMQSVVEIKMDDFTVAAPAVITILAIPLTFSIAEGIGLGLITAALLALATGKPRGFTPVGYVIAAIFFLDFFRIFPFGG